MNNKTYWEQLTSKQINAIVYLYPYRYTIALICGGLIMRECMDIPNLKTRIKKIQGQLTAISEMLEKDIPCEDILIQIGAAKGALHKVGQVVLEGHLQHCVKEGIKHGDANKTIADLAKAVEHFSRMS